MIVTYYDSLIDDHQQLTTDFDTRSLMRYNIHGAGNGRYLPNPARTER